MSAFLEKNTDHKKCDRFMFLDPSYDELGAPKNSKFYQICWTLKVGFDDGVVWCKKHGIEIWNKLHHVETSTKK